MSANHKWVIVKQATQAQVSQGGIHLPGAEHKRVCYGVITEVGPNVPDNIQVGHIAWFDENWQEQFALDQGGKNTLSALPYEAIYRTDTPGVAVAEGAHLTDEMKALLESLDQQPV